MAGARFFQNAVLYTRKRIAVTDNGVMQHPHTVLQQDIGAIGTLVPAHVPRMVKGVLHGKQCGRSPCGNPVKILGVALRLHQGFTPAIGASYKVGIFRGLAVEGRRQGLGRQSGDMVGAIGEIDAFLRVFTEFALRQPHHGTSMPHVVTRHDKFAIQRRDARPCIADAYMGHPAQATTTAEQEALGPVPHGQIDFKGNRRRDLPRDLAEFTLWGLEQGSLLAVNLGPHGMHKIYITQCLT
ncbi:hypothetical protein GLUCOINTEAF2_0203922 [Komagataeibacter intermedius AF2]|uniref:Uncharacterized protein n=1 Tax=Komagataeibacter intermedius AF2 TaxID=1458464 RepID=A0A0N0MGP5_9PROT|nr:hypothetical protein GLUCOINTEAF2_0203922 [Komagataeibacter intermedius AF2]